MADFPAYEDVLGCQAALYEWAESYDTKDWERLARAAAPTLRIDYRPFLGRLWEAMPRADFVAMASDPKVLGDPRLRTQHLVGGAARWVRGASEDEVTGFHQMRVAHQRYADDKMAEVAARGHAHGRATVWYRRVEGVWKFAGIEPDIRWTEYEHDRIFAEGEERFKG